MMGSNPPLANFILLTGYADVTAEHGFMAGGDDQQRRSMYSPRAARAVLNHETQSLVATFGHGDFVLETRPLNPNQLEITYRYDIVAARRALVQLPLILFHDSEITVDGQRYDRSSALRVQEQIRIHNPTMNSQVAISVPPQSNILLREAIYPLRWYGGEHRDQRYRPYYQIALLSLQVERPQEGSGLFRLEVE
jgi:hypothetical protein